MRNLIEIYLTFFRISSTTFGGGMTMLPILQKDIVQNKRWVTDEEIIDMYAISQGLPGIIAINIASFIGYKIKRVSGAIAASLGVVSPCIIIIMIIARFLSGFQDIQIVKNIFAGINIGVTALIFNSIINLWKKSIRDRFYLLLFIFTFILMLILEISPIIYIIISGFIGILVKKLR